MMADPQWRVPLSALKIHQYPPGFDGFQEALIEGLGAARKTIPFRFLYDERGSRLFDEICRQPEYYPTRTEISILESAAAEISAIAGEAVSLVELGSGAGRKAQLLLDALIRPQAYTAIDISRDALLPAAGRVAARNPGLEVHAVWADFSAGFTLPSFRNGRTLGFFPGSSIGNFEPKQARAFLQEWRDRLGQNSDMIIGVDLVKSLDLLEAAYNDGAGVTAQFSLNLLRRANREADASFEPKNFRHAALYDEDRQAIDIMLVSRKDQLVRIGDNNFFIRQDEPIHIESSYKYSLEGFSELARQAGYNPISVWTDAERLFSVHYLRSSE